MDKLSPKSVLWGAFLFATLACLPSEARTQDRRAEQAFEQHVRPLLVSKCVKCHGPRKQEGGLRLDSRAAMLAGGDRGPALVPGDPRASLIVQAVMRDDLEMPPESPLAEKEVAALVDWTQRGAVWPTSSGPLRTAKRITDEDRAWWAFRPLVAQIDVPAEEMLDTLVRRKLAAKGLQPAPPASKAQRLRRAVFTLWGLPPTPDQRERFLSDESESAWETLIDELLSDSRYGEHWARHWLDVVRYAESDGWNADAYRPHIWRYRDYVVRSFNSDKPYPQFVKEQLAGDELLTDDPDAIVATGFLRLGIYEYNQRNAKGHWSDILDELTDVTADVFLGMGLACARCHDHKFDPLLQSDYYQLRAVFEPLLWRDDLVAATRRQQASHAQALARWENATASLREQIATLRRPYDEKKWKSTVDKFPLDIQACFHKPAAERTSWEAQMSYLVSRQFLEEGGGPLKSMSKADKAEFDRLQELLAKHDDVKPDPLPEVMAVTDHAGAISTSFLGEGDDPVAPGIPAVLDRAERPFAVRPRKGSSGRRTALAEWIGSEDNALAARVIVNRVWQQHFGRGLVATANDFGRRGQRPSHGELLDALAADFVAGGWRFKALHKRILMSATWQQSATHPRAAHYEEVDPGGVMLWRARIRRLTAEQLRDATLSVSGELTQQGGGPSQAFSKPVRSIYAKRLRNRPEELFQAFDAAGGLHSVAVRAHTTTPTQSLLLMNSPWALGRAKALAKRVRGAEDSLETLTLLCWGRAPTAAETASLREFLGKNSWDDLCHVLLQTNEFLYVD